MLTNGFSLKNEDIVIEAKKNREGLNAKILLDQLIIDIERYQAHYLSIELAGNLEKGGKNAL